MTDDGDHGKETDDRFDVEQILHRIRGDWDGITDRQQIALTAGIRNPDATFMDLDRFLGARQGTCKTVLWKHSLFGFGRESGADEAYERRGHKRRYARNFKELTDKQRAVVEVCARWPDEAENARNSDIALAAREFTGVKISPGYPQGVISTYSHLVDEYREKLRTNGDLPSPDNPSPFDTLAEDGGDAFETPRDTLEATDVMQLPDGNLDAAMFNTPRESWVSQHAPLNTTDCRRDSPWASPANGDEGEDDDSDD
jgi:hypothetical protein